MEQHRLSTIIFADIAGYTSLMENDEERAFDYLKISLSVRGGILISKPVRDQIRNKSEFKLKSLGNFEFKNVGEPLEIFAVANTGLTIPKDIDSSAKLKSFSSGQSLTGKVLGGSLGLIIVILLLWFIKGKEPNTGDTKAIHSMAVLPFMYESDNEDLEYLSEGIAENLISQLSSASEVRIISRFSSFPLRDSLPNLSSIVRLLNVDAVLLGNMDMESENMQFHVELISASDRGNLWSSQFSGRISELPEIERQMSEAILAYLQPGSGNISFLSKEVDPEAYQHYMQGRFLSFGTSQKEIDLAINHFLSAIDIDPNYAEAYAALANLKFAQARFSNTTRQEILREAKLALSSAFSINPNLPEAHLADANIHFFCDFNWEAAESAYRRAMNLDPNNASIYSDFAFFQCAMNRYDEALKLAREAIHLDPISISSMHINAWTLLYANPEQAVEEFRKITELHPDWIWGHMKKGMAEILVKDCDSALQSFESVEEMKGDWGGELLESYLAILYAKCGLPIEADVQKEKVLSHVEEFGVSDPLNLAILHGGMGEADLMIDWSKIAIEEQTVNVALMQLVKDLDFFVGKPFEDPRYLDLLKKMDFPR